MSQGVHIREKVLLLNLPWWDGENHGVRAGSRWPHVKDKPENAYLPFPFFLAHASSLLKKNGYNVRLIDAIAEEHCPEETLAVITDLAPQYIVIETSTVTLKHDLDFIARIPARHTIIVVGPDVHITRKEFLQENPRVHFAIKGEYEFAILELLNALGNNEGLACVDGLVWRDGDEVRINPKKDLHALDDFPWPDRDDVPLHKYNDTPGSIPMPSVQMLASRGCPFGCIFCLWPAVMYGGPQFRMRHYSDVVDEMEFLVKKGYKSIYFDDDTFGLSREWLLNLCNEIIARNREGRINVPWAMMTRADVLDPEILVLLRDSGLAAVKYGVETASPDLLRNACKEYDRGKLEQVIGATKELGIKVHLTFTFGLPGEAHRSANDTIFYALHLNPDSVQFSVATPFPGTPYYEKARKEGLLVSENLDEYDGNYHAVVKTQGLSPHQLLQYKNKAYRIWGIFSRMRNSNRLLFRLAKIYIYVEILGLRRMFVRAAQYMLKKLYVAKPITDYMCGIWKNCLKAVGRRIRYISIYHGSKAFVGPSLLQIDFTNDCNNDCIGCWCNSPLLEEKRLTKEEKKEHIPYHVARTIVDDAVSMGTLEIYLAGGGEPFMYPHIMDMIRYIKSKKMTLYINTNFTLLTVEQIEEMVHLPVDHFTVSIWAGTPTTYHATHPNKGPATFIALENMLKYLQSIKKPGHPPYVKIYHVISNVNYHELDYMYDFTMRTRSESVEFTVLDTIPGKTDVLMLNKDQMKELRIAAEKLQKRVETMKAHGQKPPILFRFEQFLRRISDDDCVDGNYDKNIIDSIPCTVGWNFSRIMPNGNVNGCLKAHRIPIGNVNHESFKDIWNSPKQKYFRQKTNVFEKSDPFFSKIGNDPGAACGCYKGCDDLGRNEHIYTAMRYLPAHEKIFLRGCAKLYAFAEYVKRWIRKPEQQYEINSERARMWRETSLERSIPDPELRGIAHGYKAYKGPTHVVVDLTNKCNNSCIGCWMYSPLLQEHKVDPAWASKELSQKDVMSLLDDLHDMGTELVRFTGGGEPMLHPAFSEIVLYAKKKGLKVAVTTSLPKVNQARLDALAHVDELAVSVWAGDAETYQRMHPKQSKDHFAYIEKTLADVRSHRLPHAVLTFCYVLTNQNYRTIAEMISFAQAQHATSFYFTLVDPIEGETDVLLLNDTERAWVRDYFRAIDPNSAERAMFENYDGFLERLCADVNAREGKYDKGVIDEIPCYIGWHFSRILASGEVVPCCRGVKKVIGNIRDTRFKVIWDSPKQQEFRNTALRFSKFSPYFDDIECYKTCDNLMHNRMIHQRRKDLHYV